MEITLEKTREVKNQLTSELLNKNLSTCISLGNEMIKDNEFTINKGDGIISELIVGEIDFTDLSRNARKKIAKRMSFFMHNKSRRSLDILFHFLKTRAGAFEEKVIINKSIREQNIDKLRYTYKELRMQAEKARVEFKEAKRGFYV